MQLYQKESDLFNQAGGIVGELRQHAYATGR